MTVIGMLPSDIWQEHAFVQRFQVQSELGSGGQAVVVAAYHRELDERVALKFLLPEVAQSTAAVARFRREARAAAKIKNEHVVRIFDVCSTESGLPYIVMEHLKGQDLERCLQEAENHQLEVGVALDFILQASEAVAEGHRLGIVHRDLKPANLFCVDRDDGSPMIKVLDFGISKIKPLAGDVERTDRYEILGSPRYMSPEQIDAARDVDLRSDIWSLGVILYEALAGRAPFESESVAELWHKVRTETPRSLTGLRERLPPDLNGIVMKCLEKERSRRYANLGELADALSFIAPGHSRRSIERIRHMTGTRAQLYLSTPAVVTDVTLQAISPSRRASRPRTVLVGLGVAATAMAGFAAARFVTMRTVGLPPERSTTSLPVAAHPASTTTKKTESENNAVPIANNDTDSAPTASNGAYSPKASSLTSHQCFTNATPRKLSARRVRTQPVSTPGVPSYSPPTNPVPYVDAHPTRDNHFMPTSPAASQPSATASGSRSSAPDSWIIRPITERKKPR